MKRIKVRHPSLGDGVVLDTRHRGHECLVKFKNGIMMWVKSRHLIFLGERPNFSRPSFTLPQPKIRPISAERGKREVIEAFRSGIVPAQFIKGWTVGRARELSKIDAWLHDQTSGTLVINGEYGAGKTHIIEYLRAHALELNYATASVGIDPMDAQAGFPKRIYRHLIRGLSVPYKGEILDFRQALSILAKRDALNDHPILKDALKRIREGDDTEQMWAWLEGKDTTFREWGVLYDHTTAANIYCLILSGLSWALEEYLDICGLILLFDEAESSRIYRYSYEWQRALNLFRALILVSNDEPDLLEERVIKTENCYKGERTGLVYSGHRPLRYIYRLPTYFKVVFAVTPDFSMDLASSYNIYQIELEPIPAEYLEHFFYRFVDLYEKVYAMKLTRQQKREIFNLIKGYSSISMRTFIKAMVECLDFRRFYPTLEIESLMETHG